jgi:SAM-dependent methyltransferase
MNTCQLVFLKSIRIYELDKVLPVFLTHKKGTLGLTVLEIGAGTGWQAKKIAEKGYSVTAIDIKDSNYSEKRIWPIINYDGKKIPFADDHFDIIYSSSALEHIAHLNDFHIEMQRVLKSSGIAIHILPSGSWRFWTTIAHYPYIFKVLSLAAQSLYNKMLCFFRKKEPISIDDSDHYRNCNMPRAELIWKTIFPPRHGEKGNFITEHYYFSKKHWCAVFKKSGWEVKEYFANNLFYSGYMLFGTVIPIRLRKKISSLCGSSCHVFILTKKQE